LRRLVIAGNWKMYKNNKEAVETLTQLKDLTKEIKNVDIVIGAPFTCLSDAVKTVEGSNVKIAAENVYPKIEGAYTGEISPKMLKDIGVTYVILYLSKSYITDIYVKGLPQAGAIAKGLQRLGASTTNAVVGVIIAVLLAKALQPILKKALR